MGEGAWAWGAPLTLFLLGGKFRSSLSEGAMLEGDPVCHRAGARTPGCLGHLLQLAAPKTSRCRGGMQTGPRSRGRKDEPGLQMLGSPSLSPGLARLLGESVGPIVERGCVPAELHREARAGAGHLPPVTYFSLFSGQFLEELSKFFPPSYKLKTKNRKATKEWGHEAWKGQRKGGLGCTGEGTL